MSPEMLVVTVGLVTPLILEGIKRLYRLIIKNVEFDFAPYFYEVMIPFITALVGIGLNFVNTGAVVSQDVWLSMAQWGSACVLTLLSYEWGIKPLKEYGRAYRYRSENGG